MDAVRIFVSVVGFTDTERHALNTVFRLSEERDLVYGLWTPPMVPGASAPPVPAQVVLVDGACAEAVLYHAKALPLGQRLIWVGEDAPSHAWRVLRRPLVWGELLHDLDTVYAAKQADSGLLDLDITSPVPLEDEEEASPDVRRALLAGLGPGERALVLLHLSRVGVTVVDEVVDNKGAVDCLGRYGYCCAVINLDEHQIDGWSVLKLFLQANPRAMTVAMSDQAGPWAGWWGRRRVRRHARRAGVSALLARPPAEDELAAWFELL
jgi:hypothetical protein